MKIALFGGSFDPVHEGHLTIAATACRCCRFDRFFFVPAARSPFKQDAVPAKTAFRIEMLNAALRDFPNDPFEICLFETERGGLSYSIDTVRYIGNLFPDSSVVWIGGADLLPGLPLWHDSASLAQETSFLIFRRGNDLCPPVPSGFRVDFFEIPPIPYSSSEIRKQLADGIPAASVPGLPKAVADIIEREGLYR